MITELKYYPAMKDSGVDWLGEVPAHWEVRRLKDTVVGCVNGVWGGDPNGSDDLPCVRVADFDRGRLRVKHSIPTLRAISQSERQNRTLSSGDLLLEKSGGGETQPVGVVILFDHEAEAVCSNFVARMPVREGHSPHFLSYLHSALYAKGLNRRSIKQTTGIQNLDSSAYLSESAGLPPFLEQGAIARYLDHVDRRVRRLTQAKRKLIALLTEQKQAIIHRAVTRGLDPDVPLKDSGVEWLGEVPEHWEVRPLKFMVPQVTVGIVIQPARLYVASGIPCLRSLNISSGVISSEQLVYISPDSNVAHRKSQIFSGDIVVVRTGQAGVAAIVTPDFDGANCIDLLIIRSSDRLISEYLLTYLNSWSARTEVRYRSVGAIQAHYNTGTLANLTVPTPPVEEQREILSSLAMELDPLNEGIARAEREIELLGEYRTRLIADVVTGKLDVRDAAAALPEVDPLAEADDADDLDAGLDMDADELDEAPEEAEA